LGRAFDELVRRHETLRTTFPAAAGEPVQAVGPPRRQALPVIDLGTLAEPSREREMRRLATARVRAPFDLAREPQLRTTLIRLAPEDHVLVLSMHHIASDFWSMGVLTQELTRCYDAFSRGEDADLPELPVQYADYAVWQREWFAGGVLEEQLAYWRRTLEGAPAALELPADHPRPRRPSYRNAARAMRLPAAETGALRELGQHHQATLFMVLIAAFSAFLHRLSGQRDVLLGTPAANRTRTELEGLIGLFVNTLVLRVDLAGDPGFLELIERVRRTVLGAQAHQDLPFEQLVDELQPERHLARAPLFQVLFVLQTAPVESVRMPELSFRPVGTEAQASQFDLSFNIVEQADGLRAAVQYDSDLFDPTTIRRLLGQFRQLLAAIATAADRRLSLLPILRPAERHQLLVEWNDPRPQAVSDDAGQRSLQGLFERWAERTPEVPAVSFEGEEMSYRELNARANRLAHRLRELGVGPEVVVGMCLERGMEMVVAILAILKAGGAYLPLDPAHPPQRRRFMADDAGIGILVTAGGLWDAGEGQEGLIVLDDAGERQRLAERSGVNPSEAVSAVSSAYVIYTSGSTGRAKGTVITHGNVIRLFAATEPWFDFGPGDVWTLFHSYAFDFSVWEIWGALIYGGRLVVVPDEVRRSPRDFYELLEREGVTILNQTPAAFRQLVEAEGEIAAAGRLREVIFGGEAVDLVSLGPWFRRHGERRPRLVNMYGITETTVHVTYRPLGEGDLRRPGSSPIGVAIPDLPVVLVDAGLRPVSIGVPGEIVVAGAGLARCYLGRPALTAERFVPNPFSRQPGERLYRSGDLARTLPDGGLEYLGRIDHQVQIRGFRIELGEVEAVLLEHSGVRQVVAVLRGEPGDKRLVGYVVPAAEPPPAGELGAFLRRRLPDYMMPQAFVFLDALPLTPNGKVDRRALPAPSGERPELEEAFVAPRNPVEEQLAEIWGQVLGLERVGVHDNFFQIGGHSLLATQVASRVRHELGVELPLALVFETPTIAGLAESYWQQQIDRDGDDLAALLDELGELSDEEAEKLAADEA
ncbi:MAG: amino acid adenylation domain-containing protein, partial [bacterium]|nr:amino acid adenylation domain-containing protein [bacterium]